VILVVIPPVQFLDRGDGVRLAYRHRRGAGPTIAYVPGYAVDMEGTKACALDTWAERSGRACLRFDYSGCGSSEGDFLDGTITRWAADAAAVLDAVAPGPAVLVGSSLGGWIALVLAAQRPGQTRGLVLTAPAPDFIEWDLVDKLTPNERVSLAERGFIERFDTDGPTPTVYARALIEDGAHHLMLGRRVAYTGPVRILHGQRDTDVPWANSLALSDALASADVQLTLVKDATHRLQRASDLALLTTTLEALLSQCAAG